jgi:threonylcarbamoyladenosine tRNA methylthiotransferase MtaB
VSDDEPLVVTFGCRLNAFESEVMRQNASEGKTASGPKTIIVNTCAVTSEAERQGRQAIRKLRRQYPDARIVVTGCAVQINPDRFEAMPEITQLLGNTEKLDPANFSHPVADRVVLSDIMAVRETAGHLISGFEGRTRAFIEVQQGCDHRCTFCIIPYGRGPSRSVAATTVIEQVRLLVEQGYAEMVLTGVDVTSYGGDLPDAPSLGTLVRQILKAVPELKRLRLSSLDPVGLDEDLLRAIAEEDRLMPHLHLSVQAGDDLILKRMKRRHLRGHVIELAQRVRDLRPHMVLGADIIAGFPTETDDMYQKSEDLVEEAGITHLHVFPYSARPGTPAARMKRLDGRLVDERAARLRAKGQQAMDRLLQSWVGREARVLIEKDNQGKVVTARVEKVENGVLQGGDGGL